MCAMRLAEHVAKTTDVDGMLDSMTPQQWIEWQAKDRIEPIGNNGACLILARIGELLAAFMGSEMRQRDFMPWLPKQKKQVMSVAQSRDAILSEMARKVGK